MFTLKFKILNSQVNNELKRLQNINFVPRNTGWNATFEQRAYGNLAEFCVYEWLFGEHYSNSPVNNENIDIIYKRNNLDVKSVIRNVYIKGDYNAALNALQVDHSCDIYLFTSYNRKDNVVEIIGWHKKQDFLRNAVLKKKGEFSGMGEAVFTIDTYVLPYNELRPLKELINLSIN